MADIKSEVSVTRSGDDLEITSVVKVPVSAADNLIEYCEDSVDYWAESADRVPDNWSIRAMVGRLGLRDTSTQTALISHIEAAFRSAAGNGTEDDDESRYDEAYAAIKRELKNLTDEEKGQILSKYVGMNTNEIEEALEHPCCCHGMETISEMIEEIVIKRAFPERAMPTISDLEAALNDYIEETPPKSVSLERLQSIVTGVFMGATTTSESTVGASTSGWDPK